MVYYKKHTKKPTIAYADSVRIALCYGWIDSLVKKIDDECFARKFSPRKDKSLWSESNKRRVAELIEVEKMKPAGMLKVEAAKQNGNWDKVIQPLTINSSISPNFKKALNQNPIAQNFFTRLTHSQQTQFTDWVNMAKRSETKHKRIQESILLLVKGKNLGLK